MNDLISIIIPVYNHASVIRQSVRSIVCQTYRPIEIIIINDGSTDNFNEIEKELLNDSDLRQFNIRIINQENKGAPAARNAGFAESSGNFVIFWDADTIAEPEMLKKMKQTLDSCSSASFAYCDFKFGLKTIFSHEFDAEKLKINNYIDTTSLIRRSDFPGFDETIKRFQDWDLWLTMVNKNKTGIYLPETLYAKLIGKRKGISKWVPKIFFKLPWKTRSVKDFESARRIIVEKHGLK